MSIDYKPNYDSREAHYAAKDAATAARDKENAAGGPKARDEPKAHNYLREGWGRTATIHDIKDNGHKVKMRGFGSGICPGDFIMKKNGDGYASYKIDTIKYNRDPPDQWSATATFTPGVFGVTDDGRIVKLDNG
jgi:hypothetical protein